MPTKRLYIIDLVFFILGGIISFGYLNHYYASRLEENRQITLDIIDNSTAALKANDDLVNTCYAAYYVISDCASNLASCDMEQANTQLESLKKKKQAIYLTIDGLTKDMDRIIEDYQPKETLRY